MRFALAAVLFLVLILFLGCASAREHLSEMDQSYVNHPAMNLHSRQTPERITYLTLFDADSGGKVGGCLTCAH